MMSQWRPAGGADVPAIVTLTQTWFEGEADTIWRTDPIIYAHNVAIAVVNQFYNPASTLIWVADDSGGLQAMVWAERGQRAVWSAEEMVAVKIVHVNMTLSPRVRVRLCGDMIGIWEDWARSIGVMIICSTTMRGDQEGFLKLHERRGYDRRGSICYKRLDATTTTPASPSHPD